MTATIKLLWLDSVSSSPWPMSQPLSSPKSHSYSAFSAYLDRIKEQHREDKLTQKKRLERYLQISPSQLLC